MITTLIRIYFYCIGLKHWPCSAVVVWSSPPVMHLGLLSGHLSLAQNCDFKKKKERNKFARTSTAVLGPPQGFRTHFKTFPASALIKNLLTQTVSLHPQHRLWNTKHLGMVYSFVFNYSSSNHAGNVAWERMWPLLGSVAWKDWNFP